MVDFGEREMNVFSRTMNFAFATRLRQVLTALVVAVIVTGGMAFAKPTCAKADDCCIWVFAAGGWSWWCYCNQPEAPLPNNAL